MTEAEIEGKIRTLTPAQRRYLAATITQDWRGIGSGWWKTIDALLAKKLLIGVVVPQGDHEVFRYRMPALVEQVFGRVQGEKVRI